MSDIKTLLESLANIEEGSPIGQNYRFNDYLGGTETVRKQKPGVLATKKQTDKLVGDGGESVENPGDPIEEDMVAQLTREFADFVKHKEPSTDNLFSAASDRELGEKPTDRELTSEAKPKKLSDTPEDRRKQGRCVDCGQDLRTMGRGEDGRCRECENEQYLDEQTQIADPGFMFVENKNLTKAALAVGLVGGIGAGGIYLDKKTSKIELGGQTAYVVPEDHGKVPNNAMLIKDNDGNTWKVWSDRRSNWFAYRVGK